MKKLFYIVFILFSCTNDQIDKLEEGNYSILGDWNLVSAHRITRYNNPTFTSFDSVNYFEYPPTPFPHKYKRGDVFDTIIPGNTIWSFDETYIYKNHLDKMIYYRRNENTAYCEYIRAGNNDIYQVADVSDNKLILETNEQLDDTYMLFSHFSLLEFSRNNEVNDEFYTSNECTNISEIDRDELLSNEVAPYNPYEGSNVLEPILGDWLFVSYQLISEEGFPVGDIISVNKNIRFLDNYTYEMDGTTNRYGFYNQYGSYNQFYGLHLYNTSIIGTVRTTLLARSFGNTINCIFSTDVGQQYVMLFEKSDLAI